MTPDLHRQRAAAADVGGERLTLAEHLPRWVRASHSPPLLSNIVLALNSFTVVANYSSTSSLPLSMRAVSSGSRLLRA